MKRIALGLAALSVAAAIAAPASASTNVWSTSFDSDAFIPQLFEDLGPFPATSYIVNQGGGAIEAGLGGNYLRNTTDGQTEFKVVGLGAHSALELSFDLLFIDSWDSTNGSPAPDILFVNIDGLPGFEFTSNNASGTVAAYGPGQVISSGSNLVGNGSFNDVMVRYSFLIPHTAADWKMTIRFGGAGFQGGTDESWGIDNFALRAVDPTGAVPEPATWALMIGGFGLAGSTLRRRRAALA